MKTYKKQFVTIAIIIIRAWRFGKIRALPVSPFTPPPPIDYTAVQLFSNIKSVCSNCRGGTRTDTAEGKFLYQCLDAALARY